MTLLALDSSGAACSVALLDDAGGLLAHRFVGLARGHAEILMPMVRDAMASASARFTDLDLIAVTTGPGSFTGIRIGLAAARGLGLASGVPVLGVTAFEAVAAAVSPSESAGRPVLVAIDTKRADLFVQLFGTAGEPLGPPALVPPEGLLTMLPEAPPLLAGDGAERAKAALAAAGRAASTAKAGPPDARHLAAVALERWRRHAVIAPGEALPMPNPFYLRAPEVTLPGRRAAPE